MMLQRAGNETTGREHTMLQRAGNETTGREHTMLQRLATRQLVGNT